MKSESKYIYALTHCESCYNQRGIFTGRANSVLTDKGKQHAQNLADKLKHKQLDVAFISPLTRTKQTLEIILKFHPHTQVIIDPRIIERDYGDLTRKNKAKYQRDNPETFPIYHRSYDVPPPNGESIMQVEQRVLPFIKDTLDLINRRRVNVLIVCHSNSIRPIRRYFEKLSVEQMMKLEHLRHKIFEYKVNVPVG